MEQNNSDKENRIERVQIRIEKSLNEKLKEVAKKNNRTVSDYTRILIRDSLNK